MSLTQRLDKMGDLDQNMKLFNKLNKNKLLSFFLIVIILCLFSACTGLKKEKTTPFLDKWRETAETSRGYSPSAKKQVVDLSETTEQQSELSMAHEEKAVTEKPLPNQKISLKMHQTEVAVVLRALARAVNQNIIINENVIGITNINVEKVPWDEAFRSILRSQGLTFVRQGDIINIVSATDKENNLKQLELEQQIQTKIKEMAMKEPLITRVVRVDFADAEGLQTNLESFLTEQTTGSSLGSVTVDKHTNSLIIQAIRTDMDNILPLIEKLDKPISQILIEAHIVETTSDTARELGIQWGGIYGGTSGDNNYWITPGVVASTTINEAIDPASGYAVNFPATLTDGTGLTVGYVAQNLGKNILAVQLSTLQKDGRLNILSSPSITTLDNQGATIESGKEVPFQTIVDGEIKIEFKKAVLSLKVTPHIIDGKTLKLSISTHKDELDFTNTVGNFPTIITKNAQTSVILYDGQTTVIGGLNKETASESEAGVPWLKNIPLLGYLFKSKSNANNMEEVLIFITPHILKERPGNETISKSTGDAGAK